MSDVVIFSVGGLMFIATTWATVAFMLRKVIGLEIDQSGVGRNEVDTLPAPSDT